MRKIKVKQAELFTPDEMKGGLKPKDPYLEESIEAYLKYMQIITELDERTCHLLQWECDNVSGHCSANYCYRIETLAATVTIIQFEALKDCVDMRMFALANQGYNNRKVSWRPHVTDPSAFVRARETFKRCYSAKYEGRDSWITDMSCSELIGLD